MNATATKPSPSAGQRAGHVCILVAATLLLWLAGVEMPQLIGTGLDASWQAALVEAHRHGWSFGTDVAFTYGPWGFLGLGGFSPETVTIKLWWEILGRLVLSASVVAVSASLPGARRWVFLAAMTAAACWFETSLLAFLAVAAVAWLAPGEAKPWQRWLAIFWFSFLAHFKFVFFLHAVATIALTVALRCAERRFRAGFTVLGAFLAAYLGWWIAAGQWPGNLPKFWHMSAELSHGYSWSMGVEPENKTLLAGLLVAGLAAAFLIPVARSGGSRVQRAGVALMLAASWFVAWKQGFTRADLHVVGFFVFCLLLGLALPGLCGRRRWVWQDVNVAVCLWGIATMGTTFLWFGPAATWRAWKNNPREIIHLAQWRERFAESLRSAQSAARDPALQAIVGRGTVDVINYGQGLAILNGLNYRPRPVIQSYSAYTPALLRANRDFFRSENAPDFVIADLTTIDYHYPAQDDSLTLVELARRYEVAKISANFAILRRTRLGELPEPARKPLAQHVPHYGDDILIPDGGGHPVWLTADIQPTLLGRLRAFFYHASNPKLTLFTDDGTPKSFSIPAETSAEGFFVRPLIENHLQLASLLRGRGSSWPRTLRFELATPSDSWFWRRPRVQFSALTELSFTRAEELEEFVEGRAVNVRPISARSQNVPVNLAGLDEHALLFAHAPSEVVLPVAAGMHRLTGGHGFIPGAYTEGATDGADFTIEAIRSDGSVRRLWQRTLDPVARPDDRGFQAFEVAVPAETVRLRLGIGPGARNDTNWDWTYWGDLQLLP